MTSLQRILTLRTLSRALRRDFHVNSSLRAVAYNPANPASIERVGEPASEALAAKEKGPWTELNKEDKISIYRSQFAQTMIEGEVVESDGARVAFGVTSLVAIALLFFTFLRNYVGPTPPRTITPEWRQAQEEKMKLYNMNPITGISSNK